MNNDIVCFIWLGEDVMLLVLFEWLELFFVYYGFLVEYVDVWGLFEGGWLFFR